ncbi:DUF4232 domain-containing protein [Streptomyces sp. TP-A0356]|uniref:DUF4232 domain-containing protein n=1 Tax=Streptomyces sp. TP-A0356 TaxID=1359208 RepID=UPI0006E3E6AC|nr:DUF4232 domain-containing protein [Streptomyces sp. TP-A0356]
MRAFPTAGSRRTRTGLLATTTVALAALALTACQNGTGTHDEGRSSSAPTASSPAQSPDAPGTTTSNTGSSSGSSAAKGSDASHKGTGTGKGSTGRSSGSGTGHGTTTATPVICNGANTRVTAKEVSRPLNHMLITVKNTGSRPCDLTYYPILQFDEMQWAPGAFEESRPQAVTTLAPGQSGYAGVRLSATDGSGEIGTTGHKLTVIFQGRTPRSDAGPSATVNLPAKGVYYDSKLTATYWQSSVADALTW